jgi:DNA-binding CsgD family transcriptional regulator
MESWKDIEGLNSFYQVSSLGRVKSLKRFVRNNNGLRTVNEKILKSCFSKTCKYLSVFIGVDKKTRKSRLVHRLVAEAFIDNPEKKLIVNHINSNIFDNSIDNLEWVTCKENINHSQLKGRMAIKLTKKEINEIRLLSGFVTQKKIAKMFNITQGTVSAIKRRAIWDYV